MFGVHWMGQCVAWAIADSPFTGHRSTAWDLLSFPIFALGSDLPNLDFWQLMTANSAVWAAMFVAVVAAWTKLRASKLRLTPRDRASEVS